MHAKSLPHHKLPSIKAGTPTNRQPCIHTELLPKVSMMAYVRPINNFKYGRENMADHVLLRSSKKVNNRQL